MSIGMNSLKLSTRLNALRVSHQDGLEKSPRKYVHVGLRRKLLFSTVFPTSPDERLA